MRADLSEVDPVRGDLSRRQERRNVRPASDSILGGQLPGLEARAAGEVVEGFPEIEDWRSRRGGTRGRDE